MIKKVLGGERKGGIVAFINNADFGDYYIYPHPHPHLPVVAGLTQGRL
jgi:hypothetical protein